ncbi:hypothetical protein VST7929_02620 [Vibrio stylophorae]|uniref:Glycosyl transferase family 25 domain-containing protein n=1 Tax=Vibrio stylophorae TaxID=659351 RepID=A0ABN8DXW1_9VIBR|nr:glycosyltransferase family 25 protein [Vibrio stylophorae]CAH0534670.1 hypothetical protein VST7929_02620 [Vibrio stylophorae]
MKVIILNLPRSIERRERMIKLINNRINVEFFPAIDAAESDFLYKERSQPEITKKRFGYVLLDSEIACFSTHITAWEKCAQLNKPIIVLEDNCEIDDVFFDSFSRIIKLASEYDYIKLAATRPRKFKIIKEIFDGYYIGKYNSRCCGTIGYIITPRAAKKFIDASKHIVEPVDDFMEKTYKHGIHTYCIKPNLLHRAAVPSTIGTMRKNKSSISFIDKICIEIFRLYEQYKSRRQ